MSLLLLVFLPTALSKSISTTVTLDNESPWKYISKFATTVGTGNWEVRAKFLKPVNETSVAHKALAFSVYLDNNWEDVLSAENCRAKRRKAKREKMMHVPENGEWSTPSAGTLTQKAKTHFWYFGVSDCEGASEVRFRVKIEFTVYNSDGSHFSAENQGFLYLYSCVLAVFLLLLSGNLVRLFSKFRKTDDLEPSLLVLNIAIVCCFIGICCEVLHLWVYAYNGRGIPVFAFFNSALGVVSSLVITILFIVIASGWTLKYKEFPDSDVYIPVALLVVLLNLLIVGLGRVTDDSYYKFSEYEGVPGYMMVIIRLGLWGWFVYLVRDLYGDGVSKFSSFVLNFGVLATVYLLSQPFLWVFSWAFAAYWRNCVVVAGNLLVQTLVFSLLTHLFSERSSYYKISTLSGSVLPGKHS